MKQYPLPEATKAETLPKPLQNALLAIGPGAPTRFAYLQTKVSTGQATPDEMTEYKLFGNAVTAQTQQNIRTEQFPISEQIKTGATPEQVQGITSGSQSVRPSLQSRPQGNIKGKGPIPSTGRNDLENQGIAFRLGDAVANGKMSEPEAQDIASRLGITLHVSGPQGGSQGGVAGELRRQQAGAEIGETYGKATVQHEAETETRTLGLAGKVALGVQNGRIVKDSNMSAADAQRKGLMVADLPGEESQFATRADQATATIDSMTHSLLSETGKRADLSWWQSAIRGVAGGLGISILGTTLESSSIDVPAMNATQKRVFAQGETLAEDLKKIYGDAPKMWKSQLSRSMTSREDMLQALGEIRADILSRAENTFKSKKVSEPNTGAQPASSESRVGPSAKPLESAPSETLQPGSIQKKKGSPLDIDKLEGVKGRLDRSKFKAVSP